MKHFFFTVLVVANLFPFVTIQAQSVFTDDQKQLISNIKKKMDETELGQMTESENSFSDAKTMLENVSSEDIEIGGLFVNGSTPKAEKKSVNVKRNRIEAAKLYEKAYNLLFEACESRIVKINFPADKQAKVKELRNNAGETMIAAATKGDDYKYLKDKDLETLRYDDLKSRIEGVNKMFKDAINSEFSAWNIYFDKYKAQQNDSLSRVAADSIRKATAKRIADSIILVKAQAQAQLAAEAAQKEKEKEEKEAAQKVAKTTPPAQVNNKTVTNKKHSEKNTESSVQSAQSAEQVEQTQSEKTDKTEPKEQSNKPHDKTKNTKNVVATSDSSVQTQTMSKKAKAAGITISQATPQKTKSKSKHSSETASIESSSKVTGTIFRVQIIAVQKGKLSKHAQNKLYSGDKKLTVDFEDGLYKYRVGDFATQEDADKFKAEYGNGSFVLKFVDGVKQP